MLVFIVGFFVELKGNQSFEQQKGECVAGLW